MKRVSLEFVRAFYNTSHMAWVVDERQAAVWHGQFSIADAAFLSLCSCNMIVAAWNSERSNGETVLRGTTVPFTAKRKASHPPHPPPPCGTESNRQKSKTINPKHVILEGRCRLGTPRLTSDRIFTDLWGFREPFAKRGAEITRCTGCDY